MRRLFCGSFCSGPRVLALVLVTGTPAATASADWFLTPFAGLKFAGQSRLVDLDRGASNTKFTLGGIVGLIDDGVFGVEAEVGYSPRFFERAGGNLVASSHVLTIMGNVVLTTPRELTGDSLRPFISGGAGLMHAEIDDISDVLPVNSNLLGINIGGGATGRLTDLTSLRLELRYFKSVTNEDQDRPLLGTSLSFWRAGVGLTFRY